ncbi:long-chain fatty acid--CoA ligase [Conexibacter sp. SYSU D00693]|uniref:AMP-dependent synthetase/ligase n=1 Tax=Conexibacter sp. SYSU D00693 TaxID=2812560 RepID=UPI00196AE432|nr:AMP-dependent synthetase/ligase [Conexibacter sp. SYSU D00693]
MATLGEAQTQTATACARFQATAAKHADGVALQARGGARQRTWAQYAQEVRDGAAGLAALGLRRGDTMACWLTNCPEFHIADTAATHLGVASFSIYNTFTVEQAEHVIGDAGARVLVTEPAFFERALAVRERGQTALDVIVCVSGDAPEAMGWDEVVAGGSPDFDFDGAWQAVEPDDLCTLIYTSGTTGPPKGVQLTHRNVVTQVHALQERLAFPESARAVSFLPMAHIAERMCTHYFPMVCGWEVTTCPNPAEVAQYLAEVRPGFFFSPPRLWEKLRAAVLAQADDQVRGVLEDAMAKVRAGEGPQDGPVQQAIRQKLGLDQVEVAIVGAAPCAAETLVFHHALGLELSELYGMSETTGVATVAPRGAVKIGTVGPALDVCEVKLSDEGEVLMRGPVVMRGYRNLDSPFDDEGWLHSGDVGRFDEDGYLQIVDRIKELIINAAGKNMSPANIEATVKSASPLIGQVCVVGDARPFNVGLLVLDPDARQAFVAQRGEGALGDEVAAAVGRANEQLARVEQLKRWTVLDQEWLPGGDELTPTMKLKRKPIAEKYAAEIDALYAPESA